MWYRVWHGTSIHRHWCLQCSKIISIYSFNAFWYMGLSHSVFPYLHLLPCAVSRQGLGDHGSPQLLTLFNSVQGFFFLWLSLEFSDLTTIYTRWLRRAFPGFCCPIISWECQIDTKPSVFLTCLKNFQFLSA